MSVEREVVVQSEEGPRERVLGCLAELELHMRISLGQFGWAGCFTGPDLGTWHWFRTGVGRSCALFLPLPSFPPFPPSHLSLLPAFPSLLYQRGVRCAQAQGTLDPGAWGCPPRFAGNWSGTASTLAPAIWHLGSRIHVHRRARMDRPREVIPGTARRGARHGE